MFDRTAVGDNTGLINPQSAMATLARPKIRQSIILGPNDHPRPMGSVMRDLDSAQAKDLHRNLLGHYLREMERHGQNRRQMALDELFYDNDPWSPQEKIILEGRGQLATNFNVISTTINWLIGTERRSRTDYKVLPRKKEASHAADLKTQLMKYLSDANNTNFAFSQAFASAIKCGVGFMESGWQADDEGEPIYDQQESWRNMIWDSFAVKPDMTDARYMTRTRWADLDDAAYRYPERVEQMRLASTNTGLNYGAGLDLYGDEPMDSYEQATDAVGVIGDEMTSPRNRVRLMETWFRRPSLSRVLSGGEFSGELFDMDSEGHQWAADSGDSEIVQKVKMRMFVAIFTTKGLLHVQESPYRHNMFPFTPIWCYRRADDGMPYGYIRGLRDLQTQINKAASKAQFILSTNKTVMDEGAVDDLDAFAEEVARPDAIIVKKQGKFLELNVDRDLAPAHLELMSRMISMVQMQSGITDESLGRTTNAVSGKAIQARQDQGSLASAETFDNLLFARKIHGEKVLSLSEQFMSKRKQFRITNMRGTPDYITINDGLPENDITRTKADFVISEQAWNATMRQAAVADLMDFIEKVAPGNPDLMMMILDLLAESMDIPNREEIVKRIRQVTGQKDPDADPNAPPTPEEQAQMAEKKAKDDMQARHDVATVEKMEADAALAKAKAADTDLDGLLKHMEAMLQALTAAQGIMLDPQAAPVADSILEHAQFVTAQGQAASAAKNAPPPPEPPMLMPPSDQMPAGGAPPPPGAPAPPPGQVPQAAPPPPM